MRLSISCSKRMGVATIIALAALTGSVMASVAQTPAQNPAAPEAPPAGGAAQPAPKVAVPDHSSGVRALNDQEIRLTPGDVIQIQVENHTNLDGTFAIPGGGKLLLQEAGEVPVAGLTVGQVRDNIQVALDKTLNNVLVRVLLREVHSRHASINGVVLHQGTFDMGTSEYRFLDLIDVAGGLSPPTYRVDAKLSEFGGKLYRGTVTIPLDIDAAYAHPDGLQNFIVQPNDRISIELKPLVVHQVHIIGQIPKQGNYLLDNNTTVLGLFGQAGFPSTISSLSTAYVIRGDKTIPLDLRPLLTGKVDLAVNRFKFQDEDTLFIPTVLDKYMVWGQVGHQGNYPYPEAGKVYLLDAITSAGQSPSGEFRHVHLIRTENGKQTDKEINVDKMIRKGLKEENVLLKPDDIVFVPPRHVRYTPGLSDLFTPLALMGYFGIRSF